MRLEKKPFFAWALGFLCAIFLSGVSLRADALCTGEAENRPQGKARGSKPLPRKGMKAVWRNSVGMVFVKIPAGSFVMGSHNGKDEGPLHRVTIRRPFYLGRYEVTQRQWKAVMGDNPSDFKGPDNPVNMVSWYDAQEFIKKLNQKEGTDQYRLPTEAEWEYAARAGTTKEYSFDVSELDQYAWYSENSGGKPHPVGQKKRNPWGLYDMYGNVYEWTQDWYGDYPHHDVVDPEGPSTGSERVLRGGSWNDIRSVVRFFYHSPLTNRTQDSPCGLGSNYGIRLVFSPRHP